MRKRSWVFGSIAVLALVAMACQVNDKNLGEDLLPPGDNVFLYYDTIFDIDAYTVTASPMETSDRSFNSSKLYLVGQVQDTIVGSAGASLVTQFNTNVAYRTGPNTQIDTLMLSLYFDDFYGNTAGDLTVRIYEFTQRVYKDSVYYSDFNAEGKYNPVPLAEMTFIPSAKSTLNFVISDPDFIEKFLAIQNDTAIFKNDSIFKDYFNGFFITAHSAAPEGVMALVGPSNPNSRLSLKYTNDSTDIDTTAEREFVWTHFGINEFSSQKINIFEHDFSGTALDEVIDREDAASPIIYVQGMAGANTRLSFPDLADWINEEPIAISSANLVFDVVPEDESGIPIGDLPERLMIFTQLEDGKLEPLYDYLAVYQINESQFGGQLKPESQGMFYDTTYVYRFKMGLHFQSMIDGEKPDNNFILQLYDADNNPRFSKLFGNHAVTNKRIRLEVVYLKL